MRRRGVWLGLLAAWLGTGCLGLLRGEYYGGRSSGDLGPCVPIRFDVSLDEGRVLGVAAAAYPWGTATWDVSGMVREGAILLEMRTEDPRVPDRRLRWRGRRQVHFLEVTEEGSGTGCPAPRSATLSRK
jgi:hypothetical protein